MRQGGKVEERLFQQQRKSTTKRYANRADPSSISEVTRFGTPAYMQLEITASLHLIVYGY